MHEGGISTPLIVHWPQGRLAEGAVSHTASQLVDVFPTLLEAIGVKSPDFVPEGSSLLEALRGGSSDDRTLYWEHIGNAAIRRGQWKLVREQTSPWELYNIIDDRTELQDLSAANPRVVAELAEAWQQWADRVGVIGWDDMLDRYAQTGKHPAEAEE